MWNKQILSLVNLAFPTILFLYLANPVHEKFHNLMANALGVEGYVKFYFWGDYFHWQDIPSDNERWIIKLSGGLLTALLFGIGWLFAHRESDSKYAIAFGFVATIQFVYSFFDAFLSQWTGPGIGFATGFTLPLFLYHYRREVLSYLGNSQWKKVHP